MFFARVRSLSPRWRAKSPCFPRKQKKACECHRSLHENLTATVSSFAQDEMGEARAVMRILKEERDEIRGQLDAMQVGHMGCIRRGDGIATFPSGDEHRFRAGRYTILYCRVRMVLSRKVHQRKCLNSPHSRLFKIITWN